MVPKVGFYYMAVRKKFNRSLQVDKIQTPAPTFADQWWRICEEELPFENFATSHWECNVEITKILKKEYLVNLEAYEACMHALDNYCQHPIGQSE